MDAPAWVFEAINKGLRSFFWAGLKEANGGQCLVVWDQICKPYDYGGLGGQKPEVAKLGTQSEMNLATKN
jgi:hypothetical protein